MVGNITAGGTGADGETSNAVTNQYVLTGTTSDATETEIFIGGVSNYRISVAANSTVNAFVASANSSR